MQRQIIKIDDEKCNGCGLCVQACHEGAIELQEGKAVLVRDDYCDGLGNCLPVCPTGAITFEMREAEEYDEQAVHENIRKNATTEANSHATPHKMACGCPSTEAKVFERKVTSTQNVENSLNNFSKPQSQLGQFPIQIQLVPVNAPYFDNADVLISADCTAFAYGDFHNEFIKGKITLIGCPKLDSVDYSEKLTQILKNNDIKSLTVVRMEVPCCGGIVEAVKTALRNSGKLVPWSVTTISRDGQILK